MPSYDLKGKLVASAHAGVTVCYAVREKINGSFFVSEAYFWEFLASAHAGVTVCYAVRG